MDNNEVNKIVFDAAVEKLNSMEVEDAREYYEAFAQKFLDGVNSDDESLHKVGRRMVEAIVANDTKAFCMAVCGWEPRTLLSQSGIMSNEKQEEIYAESQKSSLEDVNQDVVDLIASYEEVYDVPQKERVTEWFGDYAMNVLKFSVSEQEVLNATKKAFSCFGTTAKLYKEKLCKEYKTRSEKEERFAALKGIDAWHFSLVCVENEHDDLVDGVWFQDYFGPFEAAIEHTVYVKGVKKEDVALVPKIEDYHSFPTPDFKSHKNLKIT